VTFQHGAHGAFCFAASRLSLNDAVPDTQSRARNFVFLSAITVLGD
jgi:hypothetical protein